MWMGMAWANTGTPADAIQQRFTQLVIGLVVTVGGTAIGYKGLRHMMDEGGGHLSGSTIGQLGSGAVLAGGGFPLSSWLLGSAGGHSGLDPVGSVVGDTLGYLLNPVGPLPVAVLYYYYALRQTRHGRG
jgi:hypothetical protein